MTSCCELPQCCPPGYGMGSSTCQASGKGVCQATPASITNMASLCEGSSMCSPWACRACSCQKRICPAAEEPALRGAQLLGARDAMLPSSPLRTALLLQGLLVHLQKAARVSELPSWHASGHLSRQHCQTAEAAAGKARSKSWQDLAGS